MEKWFSVFHDLSAGKKPRAEMVVCPPFVLLPVAGYLISKYQLSLKLGAQNISPFRNGAYTGEVSADMLKEFVSYCLIGHSERRKNFGEDDRMLFEKVKRAKEAGLKVIYCVPDGNTKVPPEADIIGYEPVWAIGTGKTDTPQNANSVAGALKKNYPESTIIYGGSVTPENIVSFVTEENISGVLPGGSSLDPVKFWQMADRINSI